VSNALFGLFFDLPPAATRFSIALPGLNTTTRRAGTFAHAFCEGRKGKGQTFQFQFGDT
jgi:hypothetical protein